MGWRPLAQRLLAALHSGDRQTAGRRFADLPPNDPSRPLRPVIAACLTHSVGAADVITKKEAEYGGTCSSVNRDLKQNQPEMVSIHRAASNRL